MNTAMGQNKNTHGATTEAVNGQTNASAAGATVRNEQGSKGVKITQTAGRQQLGEFASEFARLNDDVLFGEVWSRNHLLSLRDRSLVTVTALIAQGITDISLLHHLQNAKQNGITRVEIAEAITHLAFYAGWPKAWAAFRLAKEVWNEGEANGAAAETAAEQTGASTTSVTTQSASQSAAISDKARFEQELMFPLGEPNTAYAAYFTGKSYLHAWGDANLPFANVTFEPGCRNHWHIHKAERGGGQLLIGVAGRGWYQAEGQAPQKILPGTVIYIPANVKHWHGAAANSWFAHLAFSVPGEETKTLWLEAVTDEVYRAAR